MAIELELSIAVGIALLGNCVALFMAHMGSKKADSRQAREWSRIESEHKETKKNQLKAQQNEHIRMVNVFVMELINIRTMAIVWFENMRKDKRENYDTAQLYHIDRIAYKFLATRITDIEDDVVNVIFRREAILQEKLYAIDWVKTLDPCPRETVVILLQKHIETTTNYINDIADVTGMEKLSEYKPS